MEFEVEPIATVFNDRKEMIDDFWGHVISEIRLNENMDAEAIKGLEAFSHIEIIYIFHKAINAPIITKSEHPRENTNWPKVGIFAQRKKNRPNFMGTTICEIVKCENKSIFVKMLDAIDGTPVIDIKPIMKEFLPTTKITQPDWSIELMKNYWK
ncbi:MAG TPA: SAM-dependent methyltransferase [Chitinophagaceae bacterium]|nr:SAM-dependent methyltransferase [Chitinophagaceae bacterium]